MDYIKPADKAYKKTIIALFLGSFVTFADLYSTQPVIPLIAKQFQVTPTIASLSLSFCTGALALFLLILSFVSNSFDRKKLMTVSLILSAVLSICVGLTGNLYLLIAIRFLQGAVLAGFPSIAMAYINEEFDKKTMGLVIGIYVSGNSVGGLSGRLIVGVLTDLASWRVAILILGIISLIIGIFFKMMLPESHHFTNKKCTFKTNLRTFIQTLKQPSLLLLFGIGFILMGGFVTLFNYIGVLLTSEPYNLSQTLVGFIFIIYLVGTFSSTFMGRMADHHDRPNVIIFSIMLMVIGAIMTLSSPLVLKIIGLGFFTFGFFGGHSVTSSWVGILAGKSQKAQASSLYLLFYYTGSSFVGATGGVFLGHFGWIGVIALIVVLLVIAILFSVSTSYIQHHKSVLQVKKSIVRN
ncbi:MFS transporter [Terrilactibacillus sp. BCM23-1]|uniref:MFS transporter n=1 Tax=Terrilactibacillus tamarindi TaxID=2599694 RepID=A0A6N8CL54_9BACI|nr:MFS transporter [Terrilactibacillus tamarindi]MTT30579.1 MFS transporter [Terrilactibacillus tamarindi]